MERRSFSPTGIIRDQEAWELGNEEVWTNGNNMVFRHGPATSVTNGVEVFTQSSPLLGPPVYVQSSITEGLNAWVYPTNDAGSQGIRATDGDDHKTITPVPFVNWLEGVNAFTQGNISGLPFLNWQTQAAYWGRDFGTPTAMVDMPNAPRCKAMRGHNNRLMAMNTAADAGDPKTEETVRWSSLPDPVGTMPTIWTPAIDNSAGDAQLSGGGPVIDGASLRSSFVVYCQDRVFIMDEVGGSFVFAIRKLSTTTGVLTRNCIAETPIGHVVLSGDDVYLNDGTNFRSIIDNQNKIFLFAQIGDNFQNCWVTFYSARNEVWIAYPEGTGLYPSAALIFDMGTGKWGQREFRNLEIPSATTGPIPFPGGNAITWDDYIPLGTLWPDANRIWNQAVLQSAVAGIVMASPVNTELISVDGLVQGNTANLFLRSNVFKNDMDLGDASRRKNIRRIWPRIDRATGGTMRINVGTRDTLANTAIDGINIDLSFNPALDQKVDCDISGRYISVGIEQGASSRDSYTVTGFDIEFEFAGDF